MTRSRKQRPSVPGGPAIPGHRGGGHGHGGAEGAKNLREGYGRHKQRLHLATFNARSLKDDAYIAELESELGHINWHILGLSEVRRQGEDMITLESGHLLYYREGDRVSQGGVGILINKVLCNNVMEVSSVSTRVAYVIIRLTKRYSLKIVQVYAPTSKCSDDEIEAVYEDIDKAIHNTTKTHFVVVMGDFNAKVGVQERGESAIGPHGFGSRNQRGQMLVNFLESQRLFLMNSFFQKKPQRKWTWRHPDGVTKNEIDFIMTNRRYIFKDVTVINRFNTGSDHRLVRGTLNINFRIERNRLMKSTLRPSLHLIHAGRKQFQLELQNRFSLLETTEDVDQIVNQFTNVVRDVGEAFCQRKRGSKVSRISAETVDLMRQRREMSADSSNCRLYLPTYFKISHF